MPPRSAEARAREEGTMVKEYWTTAEVVEHFEVEMRFLMELEEEEIVCPVCREGDSSKLFSETDLENLRLAKLLVDEMEVNLAGVEIILRMRQTLLDMRTQFDAVLEDVADEVRRVLQDRT